MGEDEKSMIKGKNGIKGEIEGKAFGKPHL